MEGTTDTHKFDVLVIGTGAGGATAAALAASYGMRTLVLEKNAMVGGSLAHYNKRGIRFDMGSHLFSRGRKGPIGQLLRRLNINDVQFVTLPVPAASRGILDIRLPSTRYGLPVFFMDAMRRLNVPSSEILGISRMFFSGLMSGSRPSDSVDRTSLHEFILSYTDYAPIYYMFSFLMGIYFVLPPWEASAGESIYSFSRQFRNYSLSYTRGGADRFITALLDFARAKGVQVLTRTPVTGLDRKNGTWLVHTRDGREFRTRTVISTTGLKDTLDMVGQQHFPKDWVSMVRNLKGSLNAYQVKAVLKRPLVEEGCIIGGVSLKGIQVGDLTMDLLNQTTRDVIDGRVPDPMALYAPVPTNFDPALAPDGKQVILATIYGPTRPDPASPSQEWEKASLDALNSVIPGFYDNLEFYDFVDIQTMGRWMGKQGAPAISTGQTTGQVGRDRPSSRTPLPGLYVSGDSAGGRGIGVELAVDSSVKCVDMVKSDLERRRI